MKPIYRSTDGREFESIEDAKNHEQTSQLMDQTLTLILNELLKGKDIYRGVLDSNKLLHHMFNERLGVMLLGTLQFHFNETKAGKAVLDRVFKENADLIAADERAVHLSGMSRQERIDCHYPAHLDESRILKEYD